MLKKIFLRTVSILLIISLQQCGHANKEFTIWIGGAPQEIDFWQHLVNEYNQKTGENAILVRQPTYTDQRRQGLIVSLEAQQPNPDLFLMDVVWIDQFAQSNWLEPLNKYVERDNYAIDNFFPEVINSIDKYGRNLFALPVFMDIGLLYYRNDLLEKYGFDGPPKTWKELVDESELIQKEERKNNKSFNGFVWQGAQYEGLICDFIEFLTSRGGSIMKNGKINLNTKKNTEALTFVHDLIYKYKISPPNTFTEMKEEEVRRAFQRGNALFERNWTYAWKEHQGNSSQVKGRTGIAPLPHKEGHKSSSSLGGWHIGMSKYSDVKDEAWEFIKFVTSYDIQKKLLVGVGWNPGRKDVYRDSVLLQEIPRLKILYEVFKLSTPRPVIPYYTQVSEVMQRYVNDCLGDKISPAKALAEMQKEINQIISIYEKQ